MRAFIRDMLDQIWTFVGLFIGWLVLTGTAKTVIGYVILGATFLWMITFPLRNQEDK